MTTFRAICYFTLTIVLTCCVHVVVPLLLKKLRAFEKDCELWEAHNAPKKILSAKCQAVDDSETEADRPDRELMDVLYGLTKEAVQQISPQSMRTKKWLKVPLLIFATLPAMVSSISELLMKILGCILMEAEGASDYAWIALFFPLLILTGARTLVYINYGIKYYD